MIWLAITAVKALGFIVLLLTAFAYMTLAERRIVGRMQWRLGPNRVGPFGLLQPLADGVKLLFKEQIVPTGARVFLYMVAPMLSLIVALSAYAVIPVGDRSFGKLAGVDMVPWVADLNLGVLYLLGMTSLGVYGIVLGGWASGNKYSLLGGIRSSAQVISYELSLGLSLLSPLMMVGSLRFLDVVRWQQEHWWLVLLQPMAFLLYWTAAVAEVNRAPFDLPEAEQELGAGYHTEYSGMRFAMYFMAEYVAMITVSSVATTVFFGGPLGPFASGPWWFVLKVAAFMFVFIWLRATFPRFRYDQLMRIGWQVLLPLSLLNFMVTAVGVALDLEEVFVLVMVLGLIFALVLMGRLYRMFRPVPTP
ncbi:MAG: NADH-quinone oxidoreductase subunit NuoH [Candidatus Eremiobacterota bacterium]